MCHQPGNLSEICKEIYCSQNKGEKEKREERGCEVAQLGQVLNMALNIINLGPDIPNMCLPQVIHDPEVCTTCSLRTKNDEQIVF